MTDLTARLAAAISGAPDTLAGLVAAFENWAPWKNWVPVIGTVAVFAVFFTVAVFAEAD